MDEKRLFVSGSSRDVLAARAVLSTLPGIDAVDPQPDGHTLHLQKSARLTDLAVLTALERAGVSGASILP